MATRPKVTWPTVETGLKSQNQLSHTYLPLKAKYLINSTSEKVGLKLNIKKNEDHGIWSYHFMANRWETMETVRDFIWGGSKITADGECSHEIKRRLLLGRKVMTILDSILKSRDISLLTMVHPVKAMAFPVVMYGCES